MHTAFKSLFNWIVEVELISSFGLNVWKSTVEFNKIALAWVILFVIFIRFDWKIFLSSFAWKIPTPHLLQEAGKVAMQGFESSRNLLRHERSRIFIFLSPSREQAAGATRRPQNLSAGVGWRRCRPRGNGGPMDRWPVACSHRPRPLRRWARPASSDRADCPRRYLSS